MVKNYVLTIPRTVPKKAIRIMIESNDCKKWTIGFEEGKDGYRHYQIRLATSNHNFFDWIKTHIPTAHVEEASEGWNDYERKSGNFISSEDTNQIRSVRFGTLNQFQKAVLQEVKTQNDRQIDVYYDREGNHGKSWLAVHLFETGKAMVIPRASTSAEKLSAYVCSAYRGEGIIIIDIPRSGKIKTELYEAIEELKDGLVYDHRYHGMCRDIRGVAIIVFTNQLLDTKKLSHDRWRLHGVNECTHA